MSLNHKEYYNGDITFSDEFNVYFLKRAYDNFDEMIADESNIMSRVLDLNFAIVDKSMSIRFKNGHQQWVTQLHLQYLK
jgi:hypothetical protein